MFEPVKSQADIFYQAMLARDYRFDGKFFVGVKTTGIYCRPICPAKPKRQNVEFFQDAREAERKGYRPCLRCRPESAPLSPTWVGKSATVQRALRLISNNALTEINEDKFALKFGVSARHLRRLFEQEIGKTPKQIADSNRLDFARTLIVETEIPITEIAFTSGFSSIRRFNDSILKRFSKSPREIRRTRHSPQPSNLIQLSLSYRPPFDWASLLHYYRAHKVFRVEWITDNTYERIFKFGKSLGTFKVRNDTSKSRLLLEVSSNQTENLWKIVRSVRHMFDLDSDPLLISNSFSPCSVMSPLIEKYPGLRLPRGWNPFEAAICTILGQLVSIEQAGNLIRQLVSGYGEAVKHPTREEAAFLFPTAQTLANETLHKIGTTWARKSTIREFSKLILEKKLSLESVQDPIAFREAMLSIKGIGPWTAECIALRAIGDTDAFPESDLILRKVLNQNPNINLEGIKPWRAYAAIYLWREFAPILTKKRKKQ